MVTPEELEALDLMCWLRNGDDAARLAYCNQSMISRRCQQALKVFNLLPSHGQRCHAQAGPSTLLRMEREVHQLFRCIIALFEILSASYLKPLSQHAEVLINRAMA